MSDGPFQRLRRFLAELKRRNVYKVVVTYLSVAFMLVRVGGSAPWSAFMTPSPND